MTNYAVYREENAESFYLVVADDVVVRDGCLVFVDAAPSGGFKAKIALAAGSWRTLGTLKADEVPTDEERIKLTPDELKKLS